MPSHPAVSVEGLVVRYPRRLRSKSVLALDRVDLNVSPGEIVGVLGPNGSGKSTLVKVLAGVLRPTSGKVSLLGQPPAPERARSIGWQSEGALPFPNLSGRQFLDLYGHLIGMPPAERRAAAERMLQRMDLVAAADRPLGAYSTGMAKRLALCAALLPDPPILLLDEPTSGIDPIGSLQLQDLLRALRAEGRAILLASHHLDEVELLCDRIVLLREGRVAAQGRLDDLLAVDGFELTVRGKEGVLDERRVRAAVAEAGAEVIQIRPARRHLQALFRELMEREKPGRNADPEKE